MQATLRIKTNADLATLARRPTTTLISRSSCARPTNASKYLLHLMEGRPDNEQVLWGLTLMPQSVPFLTGQFSLESNRGIRGVFKPLTLLLS